MEILWKSKDVEGLGFYNIKFFYQTWFADQARRICDNPESLMAQVLKHLYFFNSSFMDCGFKYLSFLCVM